MLEIRRPSREFGTDVQVRRNGRVRHETLTARADTPQQGIVTLVAMANLRYGEDRVLGQFVEFIGDIAHPIRLD